MPAPQPDNMPVKVSSSRTDVLIDLIALVISSYSIVRETHGRRFVAIGTGLVTAITVALLLAGMPLWGAALLVLATGWLASLMALRIVVHKLHAVNDALDRNIREVSALNHSLGIRLTGLKTYLTLQGKAPPKLH